MMFTIALTLGFVCTIAFGTCAALTYRNATTDGHHVFRYAILGGAFYYAGTALHVYAGMQIN